MILFAATAVWRSYISTKQEKLSCLCAQKTNDAGAAQIKIGSWMPKTHESKADLSKYAQGQNNGKLDQPKIVTLA